MSLGDHLRFLRAMQGGADTATIASAMGIDRPWPINEIEVRYRQVGDDELLAKLAEFYGRPVEELIWHRERSRKKFTLFVHRAIQENRPVSFTLRSGEVLQGVPQWWDLGAVGLLPEDGQELLIVQRHAVVDWD